MRTPVIIAAVCLAALVISFACAGNGVPLEFCLVLASGWIWFLSRSAAEWSIHWPALLTAVGAASAFAWGLHRMLRWLSRETAADAPAQPWKPRWTLSVTALLLAMFCAGIAMIGIGHQIGWMLASDERWTTSSSEAPRRTVSRNNLRQIGLGLHNYHDEYSAFPPGGTFDRDGAMQHSWQARLLPWVDEVFLHRRIDFSVPWDDERNEDVFRSEVSVYLNPAIRDPRPDGEPAPSHYAGNARVLGGNRSARLEEIVDGTSNTILAGEVSARFKPWGHPVNYRDPALGINKSPDGFGAPWSSGGAHFLSADGSTRFLSEDIDPRVLRALATPDGGEPVGDF